MMYYSSESSQKDICVYNDKCPICGTQSRIRFFKLHTEEWLFIIPHWGNEYYGTCGNCWQTFRIDKEVGKHLELQCKAVFQDIVCPKCGSIVILKTALKGRDKGNKYYICVNYPKCSGRVKAR